MFFSLIGTFIAIMSNTLLMYLWSLLGVGLSFPFHHCFVFSTLVSATDPVSVLATFENIQADQNLYSLIFGESIFNDAVSLGLFRSIILDEKKSKAAFMLDTSARFGFIILFSTLLGIITGLVSAYLLKKVDYWTNITEEQARMAAGVLAVDDWERVDDDGGSVANFDEFNFELKNDKKDETREYFPDESKESIENTSIDEEEERKEDEVDKSSSEDLPKSDFGEKESVEHRKQIRILRKLVLNFNNYMKQELTIMLVSPLLSYLVAEVE